MTDAWVAIWRGNYYRYRHSLAYLRILFCVAASRQQSTSGARCMCASAFLYVCVVYACMYVCTEIMRIASSVHVYVFVVCCPIPSSVDSPPPHTAIVQRTQHAVPSDLGKEANAELPDEVKAFRD